MQTNSKKESGLLEHGVGYFLEAIWMIIEFFGEYFVHLAKKVWNNAQNGGAPPLKTINTKDLRCKKNSKAESTLGYSITHDRAIPLSEIDSRMHNFVIGASGFGKTNLLNLFFQKDLEAGRPIIFIDPKGNRESLLQFKSMCKQYKKECYVFSHYYPTSDRFNPLKNGDVSQIVQRVMDAFVWSEEFYKGQAKKALIDAVKAIRAEKCEITYSAILKKCLKNKDVLNDIKGLINQLEDIDCSAFGHLLVPENKTATLTIDDIRNKKACLYIGLPTLGYGEIAKTVGKFFVGELLYHAEKYQEKANDTHKSIQDSISVYFDEAGSIAISGILELINKGRSSGIQCTTAIQSLSDFDRQVPGFKEAMIENSSSNMIIFKQAISENAEILSSMIGTVSGKKETHVTIDGTVQTKGTIRDTQEFICSPNIIKHVSVGQGVLVRRLPFRVELVNFRNTRDSDAFKKIELLAKKENDSIELAKNTLSNNKKINVGSDELVALT